MTDRLTQRQAKFALAHGAGMNVQDAAISAGFAPKSARVRGHKLMKLPAVVDAVEAERAKAVAELRIKGAYDMDKAMAEIDESITFAKATNNASAVATLVGTRLKLLGMLTEKKEIHAAGFQLIINGIDTPMKEVTDV
jgi:phage terminase small subunit